MRNEYSYPYSGENRDVDDRAAQRRGAAWRPGDAGRRAEDGRWCESNEDGWRRYRDQSGAHDPSGNGVRPFRQYENRSDHREQDPRGDASGGYGGPSDYTGGMDWSRSGSLRQDYGDYGHAMDDRRQAQDAHRRNPGNEPHPYAAYRHDQASRGTPAGRNARPPKGYTRSDERIREDICEQLMADPYIDAGDVSVEVSEGLVRLTGSVSERNMRYALESVAASCLGVKDVENHVKVDNAGGSSPSQAGSQAARAYSTAQRYARDSGNGASSPSSSGPGLANTSVSDTHGVGGEQSRFIRPNTD